MSAYRSVGEYVSECRLQIFLCLDVNPIEAILSSFEALHQLDLDPLSRGLDIANLDTSSEP